MLAIRNDHYKSDPAIPWGIDVLANTTDPDLLHLKNSYLEYVDLTKNLDHGWYHITIMDPADACHMYTYDMFGSHVTTESLIHVVELCKHRYFTADSWYPWNVQYAQDKKIRISRTIVDVAYPVDQMSNPMVGSNSSARPSYPL
jgi:hypothetical protein